MAHALGARVTLLTALTPGFDRSSFEGLELRSFPSSSLPRYANSYNSRGDRTQLLIDEGPDLNLANVHLDSAPDVLLVAPAYHEFERVPDIPARYTGVDLQGPLRTHDGEAVKQHSRPAEVAGKFVREGQFVFFSDEDTRDPEALAKQIADLGGTALLTRGHRGATLVSRRETRHLEPLPANPVDPTGAGDCFATAFMVRLAETGDIDAACDFALAAGAVAVEASGMAGIPTREQIEQRLAREAA